MNRFAAVVLLATATAGCIRTVEDRELIVERLIDPAPQARALPRCTELPALGDTTGWTRDPYARVALPPSFEPDPEGFERAGLRHGGQFWSDDAGRSFRRIDGHYGVSESTDACHAFLNGALTVIVVGSDSAGYWVDAWPVSRSGLPTPRFDAVGSSPADHQLFLRILQTYRAPDED